MNGVYLLNLFFILNSFFLLTLSEKKTKKDGTYSPRKKEERESFVIHTAIELFNITMNFDEKMRTAFKHDHYEDIVGKEGIELKKEMDDLESDLTRIIDSIEAAGGVLPKTANVTTEIEEFTTKIEVGYDTMVKNTKAFVEKLMEAYQQVKKDKARLLDYLGEFTRLKKQFETSRWVLESDDIYLRNPEKNAVVVESFDVSVLQSLLNYYLEMDEIEIKVLPILGKYDGLENMDIFSEEYKIVQESIPRVKELAEDKVRKSVRKYDNMLRHYEVFINAGVERAQKVIPESKNMYDETQEKLLSLTTKYIDQDRRIRVLSMKFNAFLMKANEQALLRASEERRSGHNNMGHLDRDEL